MFRQLWDNNKEEFERLFLHAEVRWLSKGICFRNFYELYEMTLFLNFFVQMAKNCREVETRRTDVAYLSDIFDKLNDIDINLRGKKLNFIKAKGIIMGFMTKLSLFENKLSHHELYQFSFLQAMMEVEGKLCDNDLETYYSHVQALKEDMLTRFKDLSELRVPDWVVTPFLANVQILSKTCLKS